MEPSSSRIQPDHDDVEPGVTFTDCQAQVGPQWVDKFGRVRTPRAYYQHDDGRHVVGPEALAVFDQAFQVFHAISARTAPRPRGAGRPAVRRSVQRSSARSGDSGDDGPGEPPRGRRLNSRQEVDEWLAERKAALDTLTLAEGLGQRQLSFDERSAA